MIYQVAVAVTLLFIVGMPIAMFYTKQHLQYLETHPVVFPAQPSTYQPDGGYLGCEILNHTYFNRSDNAPVIDIYATVHANKTFTDCKNNGVVRFYGDILQSCACHNASQVNKTIDQEFPIGKVISCCFNDNCLLFNNVCNPDHPSYTEPSPDIENYQFLYVFEWFVLVINIITLLCFFSCKLHEKLSKKDYQQIETPGKVV